MSDLSEHSLSSPNDSTYNDYVPWWETGGMMNMDLVCQVPLKLNIVVVIIFIVCLVGVLGNVCLLLVILGNHRLRNTPNILIINVIIADILYILSNAPFYMKHELGSPCWGYGLVACQLRHYLPQVAQGGCVFSLTALSRERYVAIVKGLESRIIRSRRRTIITVGLAWAFGFIIGIPVLFLTSTTLGGIQCLYMPLRTKSSEAYMMSLFVIVYIIPLIFITIHYYQIARCLCRSTVTTLARNSSGSAEQMHARRRLAQVVLVITVFFGVFWLPHYVYSVWFIYTKHARYIEEGAIFVRFLRYMDYYMALANSCLNPYIVFVMSSVHRNTLRQFQAKLSCRQRTTYGSITGNRLSEQNTTKSSATNGVNVIVTKI